MQQARLLFLRQLWVFAAIAFVAALTAPQSLRAHNAPGSAVLLDFHSDRVDAELRLPLSELEISFREPLLADPATIVPRFHDRLAGYVQQHIAVYSSDGLAWSISVGEMDVALGDQPIDLVVRIEMRPPKGAPLRKFTLSYDVISHEVMNHVTLVSVRSDWNQAMLGNRPELLGVLRSFAEELKIDRSAGNTWRGFHSVLNLGLRHIAEGTDHLLFLLVLLLPAPLLVAGNRWGNFGGMRYSVIGLLKIVTAFTIGHSLTLIIGALGWLRLPSQPVEVLISISILVSAIHALRPWFAGREPFVAAGFGLVHGLAFASVLAEFQLDAWHLGLALLAFNLGIELMQLVVVLITVPWLVLLSRTRLYPAVRIGGAIFGGIAALAWAGERALGWPNPVNGLVDWGASHALWLVGSLAVIAVFSTVRAAKAR